MSTPDWYGRWPACSRGAGRRHPGLVPPTIEAAASTWPGERGVWHTSSWNAREVTGTFADPDTPSLTSPTDRPLSSTIKIAISATTAPITETTPSEPQFTIARNTLTSKMPTSCR